VNGPAATLVFFDEAARFDRELRAGIAHDAMIEALWRRIESGQLDARARQRVRDMINRMQSWPFTRRADLPNWARRTRRP